MRVEELQNAIDNAQSNNLYIPLPILDAARRWLNPNIKAAVASVFTKGGAGRPGQEWPVEMYPSDIARAVAAALTPPGDTE